MSNWQRKLDIKESRQKANDEKISCSQLAAEIARKLHGLARFKEKEIEDELDRLIEDFELAAEDEELDFDGFNYYFQKLYDWGDISLDDKFSGKKVCWIETF